MRYADLAPLFEAQQYENMFALTMEVADEIDAVAKRWVADIIRDARRILKRNDRIVWFLRWYRINLSGNLAARLKNHRAALTLDPQSGKVINAPYVKAKKLYDYYVNDMAKRSGMSVPDVRFAYERPQLMQRLEHFLSLPIAAIQDFQFKYQDPSYIINNVFPTAERKWQTENAGSFKADLATDTKPLIQFNNGFAWYLIDKAYCPLEAEAMGHCGNGPRSGSTDKILSLRQTIYRQGHEFLKPYLTFILLEDGTLGEMKGRFNNSPKNALKKGSAPSDFHNEIFALLKLPLIKGITGGGYMPEENFRLSDLPKAQADELAEMKPNLLTISEQYERFGITDELAARISAMATHMGHTFTYKPAENGFVVHTYTDMDDMIHSLVRFERRDYKQPVAAWAMSVLSGAKHIEIHEGGNDITSKSSILDRMEIDHPDIYGKLYRLISDQYRDENDIDDDEDDLPPLVDMIDELEGEADQWLIYAAQRAMEMGAENETYEAAEKWVQSLKQTGGDFWISFDGEHWQDNEININLSIPKTMMWVEDGFDPDLDELIKVPDMKEPDYGFSGFDEGAGAEYYAEHLMEESIISE